MRVLFGWLPDSFILSAAARADTVNDVHDLIAAHREAESQAVSSQREDRERRASFAPR